MNGRIGIILLVLHAQDTLARNKAEVSPRRIVVCSVNNPRLEKQSRVVARTWIPTRRATKLSRHGAESRCSRADVAADEDWRLVLWEADGRVYDADGVIINLVLGFIGGLEVEFK